MTILSGNSCIFYSNCGFVRKIFANIAVSVFPKFAFYLISKIEVHLIDSHYKIRYCTFALDFCLFVDDLLSLQTSIKHGSKTWIDKLCSEAFSDYTLSAAVCQQDLSYINTNATKIIIQTKNYWFIGLEAFRETKNVVQWWETHILTSLLMAPTIYASENHGCHSYSLQARD